MRELLELCAELDRTAHRTYSAFAENASSQALRKVFTSMAKEENQHVEWWSDLLKAWEGGLVPDLVDEQPLLSRMNAIRENLATATPDDAASLSDDEMLYTAVRLEFFMLDPVFSELIDLMGPGGTTEHRESYYRHVVRLIEAIETHHSVDSLSGFLAKVLLRAYRDQQRLAALTVRDQLTGLYNRRGLLNQLQQWLSWSARYDRPLALLLVDVDRFKSVNDTFGHLAGDEALKRVADGLRQGIRTSDILGRFGGDEFLILAPETDGTDLARLAQRILASIRSATILDAADAPTVTVSVGAAWVTGGTENVESLIAAADESLYEAKASGRNRTGAIKTPSPSA